MLYEVHIRYKYLYAIKHKPEQVFLKLREHDPSEVCISSVTYAELVHGAEKSQSIEKTSRFGKSRETNGTIGYDDCRTCEVVGCVLFPHGAVVYRESALCEEDYKSGGSAKGRDIGAAFARSVRFRKPCDDSVFLARNKNYTDRVVEMFPERENMWEESYGKMRLVP